MIRAILNSARNIHPQDNAPAAATARRIQGFHELDGVEFLARVDVEKDAKGLDRNVVKLAILPYAGGGLRSNVLDLAKWDAGLGSNKLLKPATLEQMWTPARLNDGSKSTYGFGWGITEFEGHRLISHTGSHATGFISIVARFVDDKLTVIILTNQRAAQQVAIANRVAAFYIPGLKTDPPSR